MFALLGSASVLAFTCGYLADRNVEASSKALEYLDNHVKKVSVKDLVESLGQGQNQGYLPREFVEIVGRTWAPQSEYIKGFVSGEDVVMSKLVEKEILSVPYEKKENVWERVDKEIEISRIHKGDKLCIVDESSFQGTTVSANNISHRSIEDTPKAIGLQVPEKVAGVKWIEVDKNSVPQSMFIFNGRKRESSSSQNINVNVNLGGNNSDSKKPDVVSKGYVISESVIPRLKPVVAVGRVEYDSFSDRVIFSPDPLPTEPSVTIGIQYGDSSSLRRKLRNESASKAIAYAFYGVGAMCALGAVANLQMHDK